MTDQGPQLPDRTATGDDGRDEQTRDRAGLCAEAQADGVPCAEQGTPCEQCARRAELTPECPP